MSELTYIGGALVLVVYQVYVSIVIFRADEYEQIQRILQLSIVWIVPLFGALACHLFLHSQRQAVHHRDISFVPQIPNDGGGDVHYGDGH